MLYIYIYIYTYIYTYIHIYIYTYSDNTNNDSNNNSITNNIDDMNHTHVRVRGDLGHVSARQGGAPAGDRAGDRVHLRAAGPDNVRYLGLTGMFANLGLAGASSACLSRAPTYGEWGRQMSGRTQSSGACPTSRR